MAGFGGAVKLTGETEYKRALSQINQSLRETSSELKAVSSSYASNDRSESATTAKTEVLNKKLQEQEQKLSTLRSQYSSMSSAYSEQTAKHNALVSEYDKEKAKLDEIGKTLGTTSSEYQEQKEKVNSLALEVAKSSKAQDDNERSMSKMRTQINLAQADCNKTAQELNDLGKSAEDSGTKASNAGGGYSIFKNVIANLATSAIQMALRGLQQLGQALINVGKDALQSYAQYEQLTGGVETLFGKSAPKVEKYAQQAYRTAGMSANQYMENVTSFSASLINSLGGDTSKASEYADRAMRDMSDNANKMGTDMESITGAYQSFARGNYGMLDNLKLGYGGTKSEMERLIKDASQMTDVQKELGISVEEGNLDFGNMVNAISVVQKHMGIMGTTAKEADTTIEGSVGAMKASWQNLLTGIADENQDTNELFNQFADSVVTALQNIVPRVLPIITGLGDIAMNAINELIPRISQQFLPMISQILVTISQQLPPALERLSAQFNAFAPTIAQKGADLLLKLGAGFIQALPSLMSTLGNIMNGLIKIVAGIPAIMLAKGLEIIGKLALGMLKAINKVLTAGAKIVKGAVDSFKSLPSKLYNSAVRAVSQLASGIGSGLGKVVSKAKAIATGAVNAVRNGFSNLGNIGLNLVKGIWNGISNGTSWIKGRIRSWVGNVTDFLKSLFGIHSPSTLYRDEIGKNLALGVGLGFTDEMKRVETEMGNSIPKSFDRSVNGARYSDGSTTANADMVNAFKVALSQVKIVLDDRVAGEFVDKTVTRVIYG